jgi:GTP-binding protein
MHLVDGTSETMIEDYHTIIGELEAYGGDLANRPRITVLNKIDALDEEDLETACAELEKASGGTVMQMSAVARTNTVEVLRALRHEIDAARLREMPAEEQAPWQP